MQEHKFSCANTRRQFLAGTLGSVVASCGGLPTLAAEAAAALPEAEQSHSGRGHIYKAVKWGMIKGPWTALEKFQLCKELGFDGMELNSPIDLKADEVQQAIAATGMPVHGVVDMKHWKIRLSDPKPAIRDQGVEILRQAIRDCNAFGGHSVLLVPGKAMGPNENADHIWQRSIPCIRHVLPLASRLGVRVLIENVWNGFCESPQQLRDYIDEIDSPWVGVYFDIGNAQKFAPSQDWIRTLGRRIVKLDVKGWGHGKKNSGFCAIGDGVIDWPEVRKALAEIGYSGWCTAEVNGGGKERLAKIAQRVDRVLQL